MLTKESALRKDVRTGISNMQHRHFTTIATIIRGMEDAWSPKARAHIAHRFANELSGTNQNFDHERFLKACGI